MHYIFNDNTKAGASDFGDCCFSKFIRIGMQMIFPQPLLIFLCVAVPAYFIYVAKRHLWLVTLIAIVTVCDIFNSQSYMNLAAILLIGLAVIPHLLQNRKQLLRNKAILPFAIYFLLLCVLALYHGFLYPWPDVTGLRSFKDQAPMRSVLHLGRTFLEYCVVFYLVLQIERQTQETLRVYLKAVFFASIALCFGAVLERILSFVFYHFFTGGRAYIMNFRSRSFAYEPRGLSQNLAHAILLVPLTPLGNWKYLVALFFMFFGFYTTFSFSGVIVLVVGVCALALYLMLVKRKSILKFKKRIAFGTLLLIMSMGLMVKFLPPYPKEYLLAHLGFLTAPSITEKLEVYDAASLNFLNNNPKYYLFGTGPGLVYLPATSYILPRDQEIFHGGFEALPHMGSVLILSNAGMLGTLLFFFGVFYALRRKPIGSNYIVVGAVFISIFLFQIRYFYLFGLAGLIASEAGNDNEEI